MSIGRYIFSQVVDYIPRYQFYKLVAKYHGDWHAKELTCYTSCSIIHITHGRWHDSNELDIIEPEQYAFFHYGSSDVDQSLCPGENSTQVTHRYA